MLERILAKLTPQERKWLLGRLDEKARRPANRPPKSRREKHQKAIWEHVVAKLGEGMQLTAAIGSAASKWDISDRTVKRRCNDEEKRNAKLNTSWKQTRERLLAKAQSSGQ